MNETTRELLQLIFREAIVIDFDFSLWDERLRLVVIGGLVGANYDGAGPIHDVDFLDVAELAWLARHRHVELPAGDHCQWVIQRHAFDAGASGIEVRLHGWPPCPDLKITCSDIVVSELDPSLIDAVNPSWNTPKQPLARPSLHDIGVRIDQLRSGK